MHKQLIATKQTVRKFARTTTQLRCNHTFVGLRCIHCQLTVDF